MSKGTAVMCLIVAIGVGCGKDGSKPASPVESAQTASGEPAQASDGGASVQTVQEAAVTDAPAEASTLPVFDRSYVGDDKAEASRKVNAEGLALHKDARYAEAIAKYREAVALDPANILAHYNLSCALNLSGATDEGLEILAQLKVDDCRACLAQLVWAARDSDWKGARQNPRFVEITRDIEVDSPSPKQAAKWLMTALARRNIGPIQELVHPNYSIQQIFIDAMCDPDDPESGKGCITKTNLFGPEQLARAIRDLTKPVDFEDPNLDETGYNPPDRVGACKGGCCEYEVDGMGPGVHWLAKVCFRTRDNILWLSEMHFNDEGVIP